MEERKMQLRNQIIELINSTIQSYKKIHGSITPNKIDQIIKSLNDGEGDDVKWSVTQYYMRKY